MVIGYSQIVLGTAILELTSLTRVKVPGTIKAKVGGNLIKHQIPARTQRDWQISGEGIIFDVAGTAATTARKLLEQFHDDMLVRDYNDGLVVGSFIVEELSFRDTDDAPLSFAYSITLIQK